MQQIADPQTKHYVVDLQASYLPKNNTTANTQMNQYVMDLQANHQVIVTARCQSHMMHV